MKALLGLTAVVVVVFCLLVLVVGGLWVANKDGKGGDVPSTADRSALNADTSTPAPAFEVAPAQKPGAGALESDGPTVIVPGVVGGVVYPYPPGGTTTTPKLADCSGQTGHNFAPCPGDLKRVAEVQSPGDSGSAGGADAGGGGGASCK